ncbi:methyl-accepting chemotaxis sensory transducer [Arsukibacterium tuosuense]|uniref:Methyl-accepting chemotaxis sensory transducer n=1 Tax=Arsukibacterium tuosuense TaxID=1323745 RepID=A0A285JBF2_9GAMM|nr:methyl-accepting chemotaxis protein [Arsukibacterium tuosuense]SNY57565.1 methyl-accepting chemotaxis sensory transducer [Arsukibacterium tuosuense]
MKLLRRLTIKQRLLANAFALIIAMLLMLAILFYQSNQLSSLATTQQLVEQLNTDVLMLRRHEKDFMMRSDLKYQQRLNDRIQQLTDKVRSLREYLHNHDIPVAPLDRFNQLTAEYQQVFNSLVAQQQQLGLTPEEGLKGRLRDGAHSLEQQLSAAGETEWQLQLLQLRRQEKDFLLRLDMGYVEGFNRDFATLMAALQRDYQQGVAAATAYNEGFNALVAGMQQLGLSETEGLTGQMRSAIHQTETSLETLSVETSDAITAAVATTKQLAVIIFVVVLLLMLALVGLTSRSIIGPVLAVCKTIGLIRNEHDFRQRVDESGQDEMSHLAQDFNAMLADIQHLIRTVNEALTMLDQATAELAQSTSDTSQGMQRQQSETDMVATAVTEMGATINEIASNTEMTAAKADSTNQNANSGRKEVEQTVNQIQQLSGRLQEATSIVTELEQDSQTIGSVLDVIRGIAEQTNLLALNAAIEAARAGDQGRGFAVVADEVRHLAQRTAQSTGQIEEIIAALQGRTRHIVEAMQQCRQQGTDSAEQAGIAMKLLGEITEDVTNIMDMTTQIAAAIEQQSHVAAEVNKNVVKIRDLSDDTFGYARQNAAISEEVAQQAASLRQSVEIFKA